MTKLKNYINLLGGTLLVWLTSAQAALAQNISDKTAEEVSGKVIELVSGLLKPFGGAVIFIAVVVAAFKIITSANKPEERARAISALPYIIGGGVLLGGAMVAAGFIMGLWNKVQ